MGLNIKLFQTTYSKGINFLFWNYIKYKSLLSTSRKVKLLFSSTMGPNWENNIRHGFQYTKHELEFKEFSSNNVNNYDCVVPIKISDLIFSNKIRNLIVDNPIPIPSKESILLCDDKYIFNTELIKNGFEEFIPKMGEPQRYPYILKKKIDASGENSNIIFNAKQKHDFSEFLTNPDYFTQEVIIGPFEYATHILFKEQKIISSLNIKYAFETDFPIKGKDKPKYKRICHCSYLETFSSILKLISFEGLCCFNYKIRDKRPMIIEINPRCGYSLSPYLFSFLECVISK